MIQDYPITTKPLHQLVLAEAASALTLGLLLPFGFGRTKKKTPRAKDQRTIVMVHGYMSNSATMFPIAAYLRLIGFRKILFFNYASSAGIEASAVALRAFLKAHVRGGKVDLVCHSLGGVVARVFIQKLGGHRRIERCICLGTPHKGTYNAYWVPTKVGKELRPDSTLMQKIAAGTGKIGSVRFTSIVAGSDNIVIPRVFGGHEQVFHCDGVGHLGILLSPKAWLHTANVLRSPLLQGSLS